MSAAIKQLRNRIGFTLVETCIGLVIIAMVLSAAAAFAISTAEVWNAGATKDPVSGQQITATVDVISILASARLDNELSGGGSRVVITPDRLPIQRRSRPS